MRLRWTKIYDRIVARTCIGIHEDKSLTIKFTIINIPSETQKYPPTGPLQLKIDCFGHKSVELIESVEEGYHKAADFLHDIEQIMFRYVTISGVREDKQWI